MDSTLTSVLAALSGSVIGATTPVLSNFVLQRSVTQRELTNREIAQREELYSEFITRGTACYAKALSQSLDNVDELAAIYALVNRIRLFASSSVLEAADVFVRNLVDRYSENNMSIEQLMTLAREQHPDPLNDFALKCRAEPRKLARAAYQRLQAGFVSTFVADTKPYPSGPASSAASCMRNGVTSFPLGMSECQP